MYRNLTFGLVCSAAVIMSPSLEAQKRAAGVLVDVVDEREISDTQVIIGQLVATRRAAVATRTTGMVEIVRFNVGDRVRQGQVLVILDKSRIAIERRAAEASVGVAKAGITVAEAKLKLAEQSFKRQADLRKSTAFSRSRYDDQKQTVVQSRSERAQAEAQLQMARSSLDRTEYELLHSVIKAPFDGVIIERQAQPGQFMNQGGTIATLLDISNLEVEADVPSKIANGLSVGRRITAIFDGGARHEVAVRTIIPVQNLSTRTRAVRFSARLGKLQAAHVAIGSTVTLQLPVSAPRKVISAPKDALLQSRGGWIVYVVENAKAQPRPVKLGQSVGDRIEVLSGLKAGDKVVVRGNERLRPGQSVKPRQVGTKAAKTQG